MKIKKHRLYLFLIIIILFFTYVSAVYCNNVSKTITVQKKLAEDVIRFHVRADSDDDKAQEDKIKVKNAVVAYLEPLLSDSADIDESRTIINDNIDEIKELAINTLRKCGSEDSVKVYFENSYFPAKSYGDVIFPPGEYEAFRIDIGRAEGKNWWCVLYPPLCFADVTHGILPDESKKNLKNVLTEDEYNAITERQCQFRFKYLTFLNKYMK